MIVPSRLLGDLLERRGRYTQAREWFDAVANTDPDLTDAPERAASARLLLDASQREHARTQIEAALDANPELVNDDPYGEGWMIRIQPSDASDLDATCDAISHGSLMGARGNSGVILSQILRGFTSTLKEHAEGTGQNANQRNSYLNC